MIVRLTRGRRLALLLLNGAIISYFLYSWKKYLVAEIPFWKEVELRPIPDKNDIRNSVYKDMPVDMAQFRSQLEQFIVTAMPRRDQESHLASLKSALETTIQHTAEKRSKIIWQTASKDKHSGKVRKFKSLNPDHKRIFLDDAGGSSWVESALKPSLLWDAFVRYDQAVLKADFLRYALMYFEGGVYSDMDTTCLKPIDEWGAFPEPDDNANVILGIETDVWNREHWDWYWPRPLQIVQWTLVSLHPRHPIYLETLRRMLIVSNNVSDWESTRAKKVKELFTKGDKAAADKLRQEKNPLHDILEMTGPAVFTDAVMAYLKARYKIDWKDLRNLYTPIRFDDVTILPITSFSPGEGKGRSRSVYNRQAFVYHSFDGTWKPKKKHKWI